MKQVKVGSYFKVIKISYVEADKAPFIHNRFKKGDVFKIIKISGGMCYFYNHRINNESKLQRTYLEESKFYKIDPIEKKLDFLLEKEKTTF